MKKIKHNNAPVIIFTYNRINLFKKTINSLKNNFRSKDTEVYIFIDGPKNQKDIKIINNINEYALNFKGFKSIKIFNNKKNLGLKKNILKGINMVFLIHEKIIVLEDDIITGKYFLEFMNSALDLYQKDLNVCQVSGYSYLEKFLKKSDISNYFLKGGDCLAWGTWKRAWKNYNDNSLELYNEIIKRDLKKEFDRYGSCQYLKDLKNNSFSQKSWAINWYASTFLSDMYTLYPVKSLALHIIDKNELSTNYNPSEYDFDPLRVALSDKPCELYKIEIKSEQYIENFYRKFLSSYNVSFMNRLFTKLSKYLN